MCNRHQYVVWLHAHLPQRKPSDWLDFKLGNAIRRDCPGLLTSASWDLLVSSTLWISPVHKHSKKEQKRSKQPHLLLCSGRERMPINPVLSLMTLFLLRISPIPTNQWMLLSLAQVLFLPHHQPWSEGKVKSPQWLLKQYGRDPFRTLPQWELLALQRGICPRSLWTPGITL